MVRHLTTPIRKKKESVERIKDLTVLHRCLRIREGRVSRSCRVASRETTCARQHALVFSHRYPSSSSTDFISSACSHGCRKRCRSECARMPKGRGGLCHQAELTPRIESALVPDRFAKGKRVDDGQSEGVQT